MNSSNFSDNVNALDDESFERHLDFISSPEQSEQFLRDQGLDPDALVDECLRRIKQIKVEIQKEKEALLNAPVEAPTIIPAQSCSCFLELPKCLCEMPLVKALQRLNTL